MIFQKEMNFSKDKHCYKMSTPRRLVTKTYKEITEVDLQFYIDVLSKGIQDLVEKGNYSQCDVEIARVETDLRHFFRDDKSILVQCLEQEEEKDKIVGLVAVREIADNVIFVHQCHSIDPSRAPEIMGDLLHYVKDKYPGYSAYGIVHKSHEMLKKFCESFGAKKCELFHLEEHPASTQENGWISWIYHL